MVLNGVLALSLDSGMLLACSKRVHDVGFSFDAPAPHAPSSSGTSSSKCSTGSSSDAPPSTQESDLGCSLSSCNVASNPLSDAELDALLGLPTAQSTQERAQKAETNISSAHSGTDAALHHHQASSFEPMQFAASLFAIYKNASHSNYHNHTRTAQGDDVKTLDNGCTVTVRAPTIRFIKQVEISLNLHIPSLIMNVNKCCLVGLHMALHGGGPGRGVCGDNGWTATIRWGRKCTHSSITACSPK